MYRLGSPFDLPFRGSPGRAGGLAHSPLHLERSLAPVLFIGRSLAPVLVIGRSLAPVLLLFLCLLAPRVTAGPLATRPRCEHDYPLPAAQPWERPRAPASSAGHPASSSGHPASSAGTVRPAASPAGDKQAVYEQVFGRTRPRLERVIVPLQINGESAGQTTVVLTQPESRVTAFQATAFLTRAGELMRPELLEPLEAAVDGEGYLTPEALRQAGLEVSFQLARLELWVTIPPDAFPVQHHDLVARGLPSAAKDAIPPSRLSGFLNLRAGESLGWSGPSGSLDRYPLSGELESALYLDGWVLEGRVTYAEGTTPPFTREDTRLVHDDPLRALRFVAGDFAFPSMGPQMGQSLFGLSLARNFALQPYRVIQPVSRYEFFLERASRVDILANDRLIRTLQLPAGAQDIRNLSLDAGSNQVQLVITDDLGHRRVIDFSTAVSSSLLAPGLHQFAYGVGLPPLEEYGLHTYDWRRPTLSLLHRLGMTDTVTVGGYLHGHLAQQSAGSELVWATRLGNFKGDVAVSHATGSRAGAAAQLLYDWRAPRDRHTPSVSAALSWQDPRYAPLGSPDTADDAPVQASCELSQQLPGEVLVTLSARAGWDAIRQPRTDAVSLSASRRFRRGPTIGLTLGRERLEADRLDYRAFLSVSWPIPRYAQSITAFGGIDSTGEPSSQLAWNYSSPRSVGGANASIAIEHDGLEDRVLQQLSYNGYRAVFDVSDAFTRAVGGQELLNTTRVDLGTAVVFADGQVAWSRPVNTAFALVVPDRALSGRPLGINPGLEGFVARADRLGPAVVADLQPYTLADLRIDDRDLPLGYKLGAQRYTLLPTYRSGTVVRIRLEGTLLLRGTLLYANGEPVAMHALQLSSLSDPAWQAMPLFTNRAGRFALLGMVPGRYELRLAGGGPEDFVLLEILSSQAGLIDAGALKLPTPMN